MRLCLFCVVFFYNPVTIFKGDGNAPIVNGKPDPDNVFNVADIILIQRKVFNPAIGY